MLLNDIERRAEVHEEDPDKVTWRVQVLKEVQQAGHSVLHAPSGLIGQLKGIELRGNNWQDDTQQQLLQALHYGREGNWVIMVGISGPCFFGYRDYGGSFPEGWYGSSPGGFAEE